MLDIAGLIKYAIDNDASDLHLCVGASPAIRVHGQLKPTNFKALSAADTLESLLYLMNADQREIFEKNGQIDLSADINNLGRFRVNAYKQRGSITIAIRIVKSEIPSCEYLQIPKEIVDIVDNERGLFIICGVARSGKSTVMASLIDYINSTYHKNIITLENPIEYIHTHKCSIINQREIGLDTRDYVSGMAAALREDPDVVMINSFKDAELISLSMDAARMNRLVLVSMDADSVKGCIEKILLCFKAEERDRILLQISECLRGVMCRELKKTEDGTGVVPSYEICIIDDRIRDCIKRYRLDELCI